MTVNVAVKVLDLTPDCGADRYYDGLEKRCIHCSIICLPDVDTDFCYNNCPGQVYYVFADFIFSTRMGNIRSYAGCKSPCLK